MTKRPHDCRRLTARLLACFDQPASSAARRAAIREAGTCPRCRTTLAELEEIVRLCRRARTRPLPAGVRQRARDCARAMLKTRRRAGRGGGSR